MLSTRILRADGNTRIRPRLDFSIRSETSSTNSENAGCPNALYGQRRKFGTHEEDSGWFLGLVARPTLEYGGNVLRIVATGKPKLYEVTFQFGIRKMPIRKNIAKAYRRTMGADNHSWNYESNKCGVNFFRCFDTPRSIEVARLSKPRACSPLTFRALWKNCGS